MAKQAGGGKATVSAKAGSGSGSVRGGRGASSADAPVDYGPSRTPTWQQRAVVAVYIYFIPVLVLANAAMLLSKWTAVPWLM